MTNEQLAGFIKQGGNNELIPILWENVKKLLYKFSDRYYRAYSGDLTQCGITAWDIKQQAYSAFLKAIEGYDDSKGYKFTAFLKYPFKKAVRELRKRDPLNDCESLNSPVNDENEDTELIEFVADEHSTDFVEQLEQTDEAEIIKKAVHKAIDKLPEREAEIVKAYYLSGKTYADIAADKEISTERVRQINASALRHLRGNTELKLLGRSLGYCSHAAYHNTVSGFARTGISNVEVIAIAHADEDMRERRRDKYLKEYELLMNEYCSGKITAEEFTERELQLDKLFYCRTI